MRGDTSGKDTIFSNKSTVLPKLVIGVESDLNKWFVVRTGVTKTWFSSNVTKASSVDSTNLSTETNRESPYSLSLGWGIKFSNFELDLISDDILFVTPSIRIGATYSFSK